MCSSAKAFSAAESSHPELSLFGVTDGKAVGTYLEHKFRAYLVEKKYSFRAGNLASGIDFPDLGVDMKGTSVRQPQSSCPFKSARQKIFGLGYGLIVFVYDKADDLMAFMSERTLPVDEIELKNLAEEIMVNKPHLGYLTISNALQWRLDDSLIRRDRNH